MSDNPIPPAPRRGRPPKIQTAAEEWPQPPEDAADSAPAVQAVAPAAPTPVRRGNHAPDAGVKEYGISLDEISRRSRLK